MLRHFTTQASVCAWLLLMGSSSEAQERFELIVPGSQVRSSAELTAGVLRVTNAGTTHAYQRDAKYDAAGYRAYTSAALGRVIRWPVTGQGNMQIGTLSGLGAVAFQPSQMQVRRIGGGAPLPPPPPQLNPGLDTDIFYRLNNQAVGRDWALDGDRQTRPAMMARTGKFNSQYWRFTSVAGNRYRLTNAGLGPRWSLAVDRLGHVAMSATADNPAQYWRIVPRGRDAYQLISDALDLPLDVDAKHGNVPIVDKLDTWNGEHWVLARLHRAPPPVVGGPRLVSREPRPPGPLKPANVEFANTHRREVWVLITDRRDPLHPLRLKIPPGTSQTVPIDRDPGEVFVETWEAIGPTGDLVVEQRITRLPPRQLYDVSVYEAIIQSIAIDSTKKGKGRIEDMQVAPKSVGAFPLAAGDGLVDVRIDVYGEARVNRNPGGVRRLDLREWHRDVSEPLDPIERRLQGRR